MYNFAMRRLKTERRQLAEQIKMAAQGILGEPAWPAGAPTAVEVQALADEFEDLLSQLGNMELQIAVLRETVRRKGDECQETVRRIDHVTSVLYGLDSVLKGNFGLRPIDTVRSSPGPTPKVGGLRLADGLAAGSLAADWKRVPRAVYEVQWFFDAALAQLVGSAVSTRSSLLIPALSPGTQVWVRVRALRGKRFGDWSAPATRIANV